ncbi:hypothetical protein QI633_08125 [Nocardioides sp. QY071]|uniref:hypothetical protein n=1 Tax=Nocardioides sp. QY071 TaxID=3044187 RepID=UPI00249B96C5|nr:hypothetical protein [Nocardioides sp. QY071]WGY03719.1 hypothetical protein QI633_08125 [Nocardioides sp. QY071]
MHGCAFCCVEEFPEAASWFGTEEPPLGPPAVWSYDDLPPEWYREGTETWDALMLWEKHVTDDECEVCTEIVWRTLSYDDQHHQLQCLDDLHCLDCGICAFEAGKWCRECRRCWACAEGSDDLEVVSSCQSSFDRYSKALRRYVDVSFETHDWWEPTL